ncbi:MAG TPA: Fic family protein [Ignavibacteria bacterium]|nr:Fic family protein [Ignavibacteria bacterium]HMR42090.1 Fic family protein [Ignavibacteria bacterium]
MKIEEFISGHFEKGYNYKYFVPEKINHDWTWDDPSLSVLLEKASMKLGELNSMARMVPDIDMFIQMHVTNEAVISSKIEGTKTNIEEALLPEEEVDPEKRDDRQEVRNYTKALNDSIKIMEKLPLSTPLIKEAHKILMENVRGKTKLPGEFRSSQNWIGGASLADAVFIPPSHEFVGELMGDLENFIHNNHLQVPELIRIALAHYQFETIHPFLDGNGRIGRLMITLFLVEKKILDKPLLYLSYFFEKNRNLYYDNLSNVRTKNDLLRWIKYFLVGIEEVSGKSIDTLKKITVLKEGMEAEIRAWKRRNDAPYLLMEYLFQTPFVTIADVQKITGLSKKSAGDLVKLFEEKKFIFNITKSKRYVMYIFKPYLDLFKDE